MALLDNVHEKADFYNDGFPNLERNLNCSLFDLRSELNSDDVK